MRTLILAALIALPVALPAQPGPPWHRSVERVEQLRKMRLVETLGLGEEESVRFFARLREHDARIGDLRKEKNDLLDRLDRLIRNEAAAEDLRKLFPDVLAAEGRIAEEQRKFFEGLGDLLDPPRQARFLLFERQFERELREAMRQVQRRRGGPGGD